MHAKKGYPPTNSIFRSVCSVVYHGRSYSNRVVIVERLTTVELPGSAKWPAHTTGYWVVDLAGMISFGLRAEHSIRIALSPLCVQTAGLRWNQGSILCSSCLRCSCKPQQTARSHTAWSAREARRMNCVDPVFEICENPSSRATRVAKGKQKMNKLGRVRCGLMS